MTLLVTPWLFIFIVFSVTRLGNLLDFGNFSMCVATISLPKSPTFLGNFCKGVKICNFSSEINFVQLLQTFGDFLLVTLIVLENMSPIAKNKQHRVYSFTSVHWSQLSITEWKFGCNVDDRPTFKSPPCTSRRFEWPSGEGWPGFEIHPDRKPPQHQGL